MAFDAMASRVVLFGGTGLASANLDDTWELNAASGAWSSIETATAPVATTGAVLGYDEQSRRAVVVAGLSYSSSGKFTPQAIAVWQLDRARARWDEHSHALAPPALRGVATFDSDRGEIVAPGTLPPPERPLMWAFDSRSSAWNVKDVTNVAMPFSAGEFVGVPIGTNSLVYSSALRRVFEVRANKLAEWDGVRWSTRCDLTGLQGDPLNVLNAAVAFDSASQSIYVHGGAYQTSAGTTLRREVQVVDADDCSVVAILANNRPSGRTDASAVWDSDRGRLILFGGQTLTPDGRAVAVAETWELDVGTRAWLAVPGSGPSARSGATAVFDPVRKRMILHGGRNGFTPFNDTWELDPVGRAWTRLDTLGPTSAESAALTFDTVRRSPALVSTLGTVWHLVGGAWQASLNPLAPSARSGMSGGWNPVSGLGIFFGGTSGDGQRDFLGDLWIWRDGWRGQYTGVGGSLMSHGQGQLTGRKGDSVPAGRTGHVLATGLVVTENSTSTHVALLFGGEGASDKFLGLFGDTWKLDEKNLEWEVQPAGGPRGRTAHAMALFPTQGYLLFGGLGRDEFGTSGSLNVLRDTPFDDTWLWRPSGGWRKLTGSGGPSARYGHAMATDESTKELILFGGRDAAGVSGETWSLNVATTTTTAVWRKLSLPRSPLPRFGHSMTYDPIRRRIVLTGGEGASADQGFGDTWEWDSVSQRWTSRNIQPLDRRAGHVSFFDTTRGQLLAFGGFAHRDGGQFALTHGDTVAFLRASESDPALGFPNGSSCVTPGECVSGNCVDGFCCNSSCLGQCGACDVSGFEGTCSPVRDAPHGARAACGAGGGDCARQCNGIDMTSCVVPAVGTSCGRAPGCEGTSQITGQGSCDATGACVLPQVSCVPFTCATVTQKCATNCQGSDSLCAPGHKCNAPGGPPFGQCYKATIITSLTAAPSTAVVGVPMTFTATATEPSSKFRHGFGIGLSNFDPGCFTASCTWVPTAAHAGKTIVWKVTAGAAPNISGGGIDDTETLTFVVGQP